MNTKQRIHLMAELWPNAAAAMHWPSTDREKRLDTLSAALGRSLESANEIKNNDDFTRVKNHLLALATGADQKVLPPPAVDPCASRRRKVLAQAKCLHIYMAGSTKAAETYVKSVIADIANRAGYEKSAYDQAPLERLLTHLTLEHLTNLVKTLDNRLHNKKTGFRTQAGHSLHDMFTQAGVDCPCAPCRRADPF